LNVQVESTSPALKAPREPALALDWLRHPVARPLAALAILLLIDLVMIPGFFHLKIKDGHLYGSVIDIVNRAAPLMLTALGMTLVIATRGIDISVGAVVALSGTVGAVRSHGRGVPVRTARSSLSRTNYTRTRGKPGAGMQVISKAAFDGCYRYPK
jgi:simple sugar transport system permease protein